MTRPRAAAVIAVALVSAIASGCADDGPGPATLPTITATPTLSPSPTPSPTLPAPTPDPVATEESREGVEAFVRYAIAVINHAYATGQVQRLRDISTQDCTVCNGIAESIHAIWSTGGKTSGSQITIEYIDVPGLQAGVIPAAAITARTTDYAGYDADGNEVERIPGRTGQIVVTLTREEGKWRVAGLREASSR